MHPITNIQFIVLLIASTSDPTNVTILTREAPMQTSPPHTEIDYATVTYPAGMGIWICRFAFTREMIFAVSGNVCAEGRAKRKLLLNFSSGTRYSGLEERENNGFLHWGWIRNNSPIDRHIGLNHSDADEKCEEIQSTFPVFTPDPF